ncbi:PREDICTED: pectinesterase-like [Ipomoea nil]|uniref:pectinesterase-like n=1 Tax=Ipomoea nil TaxID=35883 RepID=UPI000901D8BF|nr:PREDICTED: pectinesterase-like [Ipomoea nil]
MSDPGSKKNAAIASVAGVLLVACAVAATVSVSKNGGGSSEGQQQLTTSTKSAHAICATTDYKDTCETSLSNAKNTSNPKELIKVAFDAAMKNLSDVISHSPLLKKASKDPRTSGALDVCKQVLNDSMDDMRRSLDKVEGFGMERMKEYSDDVKVWLSGAITNQQTCLDAFQNTTGDTGEKMKKLLNFTGELTSNGLAMVTQFSEVLQTLDIPGLEMKKKRRLLEEEEEEEERRRSRLLLLLQLKPKAVVAKDGSGRFKTIKSAISAIPPTNNVIYVIKIKAGIYKEQVTVPRKMNKVVFVGDGPTKTKITGGLNFIDGTATFKTATVAIQGDGFMARDIGIENSAGAVKHQAVALRVSADDAIFYNCRIDGYQDSLYTHSYRQYFRNCTITGTIDFIFGDAAAVFQNCRMIVRKPLGSQACMITAQGRQDHRGVGAIVIQNSEFLPEAALKTVKPPVTVYLGRPWKEYSRTIIMKSYIDAFIHPTGWAPWMGNFGLNTCWYAEYQNRGPGAKTNARVNWKGYQKRITPEVAKRFTAGVFLKGDAWIKPTGIPYNSGI